jgi:hypothetical protein
LIDQDFLRPGEAWNQQIGEAIARCSVVLGLMTPAAAGSHWVNNELVAAIEARRPVLPVALDSGDVGLIRQRFAIVADRHWLLLGPVSGLLDTTELDNIAMHLQHLAEGSRPDPTTSKRERLGTLIRMVGFLMLVGCAAWFVVGLIQATQSMGEFFRQIVGSGSSDPSTFDQGSAAWLDSAHQIIALFVALPAFLASIVMIVMGSVIRRNARRKTLMKR